MDVESEYDVFLNHHGPDTKSGFMSHLEESLTDKRLKSFLDKRSLKKGADVRKAIDNALGVVSVYVAVLSKGYAGLKYCLYELEIMIGSGKRVIPVFYDVEPDDLRLGENSKYAAAFEHHKSQETPERVTKWKDALRQLANISGFRSADYSGDEAKLKREVVDAVMSHMNLQFTPDAEGHSYKTPAGTSSFGTLEHEFGESSVGKDRSGARTSNIYNSRNLFNKCNIGKLIDCRNHGIAESRKNMSWNRPNVGYSIYEPVIKSRSPQSTPNSTIIKEPPRSAPNHGLNSERPSQSGLDNGFNRRSFSPAEYCQQKSQIKPGRVRRRILEWKDPNLP